MHPKQKILYFRYFFCGREDVYAFRVADGGYRPRRRPDYDLTDRMLGRHMQGHVMLGAYPIMLDGTTRWVAADFDGKNNNAFEEAKILSDSLKSFGIETLCNSSQSGKGVHVRVIFNEYIESWIARNLMNAFIEMNGVRHLNDGGAFDRLFPTQDELDLRDLKSIGNQIAMPLHMGAAEQRGGTILLDNEFQRIPLGDATWDTIELYGRVNRLAIVDAFVDIDKETLMQTGPASQRKALERRGPPAPNGDYGDAPQRRRGLRQPSARDLYYIVNNCEFMHRASSGGLNYDEWFVLATVLTRYDGHGGRRFFHSLSSVDRDRYNSLQAEKKYDDILLKVNAPVTCETLASYGWRCPRLGSDGVCNKFRDNWGRGPRTPATIPVFVEDAA